VTARRLAAASLLLLLVGGPAGATHAPDHRFIVLGYVIGEDGRGQGGVPVVITRVKTGFAHRVRTEGDGFYLLVVHLHDEDEGDRLLVRAGVASGEIVARYDVRDHKVERGTRVDVRAGQLVEQREAFAETLRAFLAR
jgi:hypothetical protein